MVVDQWQYHNATMIWNSLLEKNHVITITLKSCYYVCCYPLSISTLIRAQVHMVCEGDVLVFEAHF